MIEFADCCVVCFQKSSTVHSGHLNFTIYANLPNLVSSTNLHHFDELPISFKPVAPSPRPSRIESSAVYWQIVETTSGGSEMVY